MNPVELTTLDVEQVQREHVIDWLIANHDGHAKQFLRARDGTVYGIDKGQAFKHLGEDRLSIAYHPNGGFGEKEPFYNTLFRAVKGGDVEVDPAVTLRTIDLPPVIRPPVLLVRMLQEPVADSPRRCGAGRDYRSAASVQ